MDEVKAYCMKCKAERTMSNVSVVSMKNGRPAANGTCPVCGTKMFKFLPKGTPVTQATAAVSAASAELDASPESTPAETAAPVAEFTGSTDPM